MISDVENGVRDWLARHQGVISRQEALRLGLTEQQIVSRLRTGAWVRQTRGVYRLTGSPPGPLGDLRAAVLACGRQAAASHLSAAWLWGLADAPPPAHATRPAPATRPTVTIPHTKVRDVEGVRVVRSRITSRLAVRRGIPCTDPVRTILDCAADMGPHEIDDLVDRALARRLARVDDLVHAVERSAEFRRHPGRVTLAARLVPR
ncbi:MAG TPA: type IV toxin-antitoxin system AbiEi family antitoxin domain-containing protein, partial [Acidimicrobiales bacterium]|nr:type IV toxin-antitoxin system AbiEi family antitoxin domain-containing protein [Acidimicrobiales bacterium]